MADGEGAGRYLYRNHKLKELKEIAIVKGYAQNYKRYSDEATKVSMKWGKSGIAGKAGLVGKLGAWCALSKIDI